MCADGGVVNHGAAFGQKGRACGMDVRRSGTGRVVGAGAGDWRGGRLTVTVTVVVTVVVVVVKLHAVEQVVHVDAMIGIAGRLGRCTGNQGVWEGARGSGSGGKRKDGIVVQIRGFLQDRQQQTTEISTDGAAHTSSDVPGVPRHAIV